ncbi:MAG TPA: lysylphosphatidylglycerol synthase transmembrane domain-containing protein [Thermoanaerobaculia bacterium]|nr:lysylphosphatidylglycerol synthase transmembrane domain-containing protein [Thermoanaerobaculia bacterium]
MKRILHVTAIAALTILFIALFLRNSDPGKVWEILRSTSAGWLALGLIANVGALVCRTLRWRTILNPADPPPFYSTFFANAVGYMLSTILPVRAGDIARPALLSRRTNIKFSTAFGTVVTERVFDLFAILTLFVTFVLTAGSRFTSDPLTARKFLIIQSGAVTAGLLLLFMGSMVASIFIFGDGLRKMHERLGRLIPRRFREGWMRFFDSFVGSLDLARRGHALPKVILLTAGIWLCLASQFYFSLLALRHPLPFSAGFFLTSVTILGLMIPTPGGVGGFHKACQVVLTNFYHFNVSASVAVALVVHVVGVLPVIAIGGTLVLREGITWRQLSSIKDEVEEKGE